jgi:hypothetical protein
MSENNFHTHETCDALPLAVALTQCQQRYDRLDAIADRLAAALALVTTGWDDELMGLFGATEAMVAYLHHKAD